MFGVALIKDVILQNKKGDWALYDREHETVLMCLKIAKWIVYDSDKSRPIRINP